jgi:hypothetical protein
MQPGWAAQLAAHSAAQQAAENPLLLAASTEEKEKEKAARLSSPSRPAVQREKSARSVL